MRNNKKTTIAMRIYDAITVKTIWVFGAIFFVLLLSLSGLTGCAIASDGLRYQTNSGGLTTQHIQSQLSEDTLQNLRTSVVRIRTTIIYKFTGCEKYPMFIRICNNVNKKLLMNKGTSHLTGSIIKYNNQRMVLTASHGVHEEYFIRSNFMRRVRAHYNFPSAIKTRVMLLITVRFADGEESFVSKRHCNISTPKDICVLKVENIPDSIDTHLEISKHSPRYGQSVWYSGDPKAVVSDTDGAMPIFTGFNAGMQIDDVEESVSMYSIYAISGTSGSAIIDYRGNVLGMVQRVFAKSDFVVLSLSVESMHRFLKNIPKSFYK